MTPKHTAGPWKRGIFSDTAGDVAYIWPESNGHTLARVQGGNVTANSLLISAAPDMLAALDAILGQSMVAADCGELEFRNRMAEIRALAYTAISKATGE